MIPSYTISVADADSVLSSSSSVSVVSVFLSANSNYTSVPELFAFVFLTETKEGHSAPMYIRGKRLEHHSSPRNPKGMPLLRINIPVPFSIGRRIFRHQFHPVPSTPMTWRFSCSLVASLIYILYWFSSLLCATVPVPASYLASQILLPFNLCLRACCTNILGVIVFSLIK